MVGGTGSGLNFDAELHRLPSLKYQMAEIGVILIVGI